MAEAGQLILPLRGALLPVPAAPQYGVCSICHSSASPEVPRCRPCQEAVPLDPPEILPVTLSVHSRLLHDHLRGYKDSQSPSVRARMSLRLAGLLALFVSRHASCIGGWDRVMCVPSARRVALEPVVQRIPRLAERYRRVLVARPLVGRRHDEGRDVHAERFAATEDVAGQRVLLLDDTFVTGASLFSAVAALRERGAVVVGPVVIARHLHSDWPATDELLSWLGGRPWDEYRCARCAGERQEGTLL